MSTWSARDGSLWVGTKNGVDQFTDACVNDPRVLALRRKLAEFDALKPTPLPLPSAATEPRLISSSTVLPEPVAASAARLAAVQSKWSIDAIAERPHMLIDDVGAVLVRVIPGLLEESTWDFSGSEPSSWWAPAGFGSSPPCSVSVDAGSAVFHLICPCIRSSMISRVSK